MTINLVLKKRIRQLSQALILSGIFNISILSLFLYWILRERPPTPYFELKPANLEQQQVPLADPRGANEVIHQLSQLSFSQLLNCLSHKKLVENGYAERDLALACLMTFHHFDINRALPQNLKPRQKRLLSWTPKGQTASIGLIVYPDLTDQQFDSIRQFATTETWPLKAEGLFLLLQEKKKTKEFNNDLIETFALTPEFWIVELLFSRSAQHVEKMEILMLLLEGSWDFLTEFVEQQRVVHDSSDARRQKFLLDYLKKGCSSAAMLLLKTDWEFSIKKLDDQQVIAILKNMPQDQKEGFNFAKEMLASPRSMDVWKQASIWLYAQAGETMPEPYLHQTVLSRFCPEASAQDLDKVGSKPDYGQNVSIAEVKSSAYTYTVQEKDSLWKIARRFDVKVEELRSSNNLKSDTLKPGRTLKIPAKSSVS